MDSHAAVSPFASVRSTAEPSPSIARHVGELVAQAAAMLREKFERGKLSSRTKTAGGDMIFELVKLRMFMMGTWDFDRIAMEHSKLVLQERSGSDVNPAAVDELVEAVMDILRKVARKAVN